MHNTTPQAYLYTGKLDIQPFVNARLISDVVILFTVLKEWSCNVFPFVNFVGTTNPEVVEDEGIFLSFNLKELASLPQSLLCGFMTLIACIIQYQLSII